MGKVMQKAVLITGCSSGIGLAAARYLLARGYRVLAACRQAGDVARLATEGFEALALDLDDPQSVDAAADEVLRLTGSRLYGLFNNAGYGMYGSLATLSRRQLSSNFSLICSAFIN